MIQLFRYAVGLTLAGMLATTALAEPLAGSRWRVTLETGRLGPLETLLAFEAGDGVVRGKSVSGAIDLIRALPGAREDDADLSAGLFAFTVSEDGDGWSGELVAPWAGRKIALRVEQGRLTGSIDGGLFGGSLGGTPAEAGTALRDYEAVLASVDGVVASRLFDPADLETAAYRTFRARLGEIAAAAADDLDFLLGFRFAWRSDPFSHFEIRRSPVPAEAMIASFDDFRIGSRAARVAFEGDVALLTVDTMMGEDTIEYIREGYREIAARRSRALVIDLRGNGGGAFAVKPLVEHVIDRPLVAGYFLSQKWNAAHDRPPTAEELAAVEPWEGWSIIAFWRSVQEDGLLKIRFEPAEPNFDGPVFLVVDGETASAAELAADAFRSSGLTTLVGERTAGEMLSQSFFDAADGFLVSLPVADYVSLAHGRIEGAGVAVDVESSSADALDRAKVLARAAIAGE